MFSRDLSEYAQSMWNQAAAPLPCLDGLTEDETVLCKLAYGTLPASDTASVGLESMLDFVRHALYLREHSVFSWELSEDIFLHFVFYPRINSENITPCRQFFYHMISPRIAGMNEEMAILEVNRWCAEQVTYQASNPRTESPVTAYYSGIGRCGEESTFTVTALRSVGIPARQIYVPYWAHCDDNHAWVEAYANGKWYFLGACEPEPILNRGWFTDASSRAPLICYRRFFDFAGGEMAGEQCIDQNGRCLLYNVIDHYAPASDLTVKVLDESGKAVQGAKVIYSVVNMAAFSQIASLQTDENGLATIHIGKASVHIETWYGCQCAFADLSSVKDCKIVLVLKNHFMIPGILASDYYVPPAVPVNKTVLTALQQAENNEVLRHSARVRTERIESYFLPEYQKLDEGWQRILRLAAGNAAEIYSLITGTPEEERSLYKDMLLSMEEKDYRDTSAALLRDHMERAAAFRDRPHFTEEILCPRICNEMLECWRAPISDAFTDEEKNSFLQDPAGLMDYICTKYTDGGLRYYSTLSVQPTATLRLGHTDEKGRKLLFVAILRTLGMPARINPTDSCAEYFRDGCYHRVGSSAPLATCTLRLSAKDGQRLVYASNYSISRLEEGGYRTLEFSNGSENNTFCLVPGFYRLLTSTRLPNGCQQCVLTEFSLQDGENRFLDIRVREPQPFEMLSKGNIDVFRLRNADGRTVSSEELLSGPSAILYLDVRKEPTEHILNEITDKAGELRRRICRDLQLIYVLHDADELSDPTLSRALKAVPEAEIYYDDFDTDAAVLARKLFLEPGVWPLIVLTDGSHRGYYGTCGYQVGTLELLLKLADCIRTCQKQNLLNN